MHRIKWDLLQKYKDFKNIKRMIEFSFMIHAAAFA